MRRLLLVLLLLASFGWWLWSQVPSEGGQADLDTDDQTAAEVANTPAGNISATNVQAAINELDTEKTDDQTATEVANTPAGSIAATTVQAAINELDSEKQPLDAALTALAAGSDFVDFTGPTTAAKTFTLPNADATLTYTVASGTAALGTSEIASTACAAVVTVAATGVVTTDVITWTPNADISAVTGYAPVLTGGLTIYPYPTSGNVNWLACNPTASAVTPGAVTLNWRVVR